MDNLIDVKICVGTYSYVMGGADLMNIETTFPDSWKDKVRITGVIEIPGCDEKTVKPPYVSVSGKIIGEATVEKIKAAIENELMNIK